MNACFIARCFACNRRIRRQCVNHDVCCDPICRVIWSVLEHVPAYPPQNVYGLGWFAEASP